MKAKTILITHKGDKIENEGDSVVAIQGNLEGAKIMVNVDWSMDRENGIVECKSMFGGLLGNLEDMFGEKFVTEVISHWAEETERLIKNDKGQAMLYFKSRGLDFKKGGI